MCGFFIFIFFIISSSNSHTQQDPRFHSPPLPASPEHLHHHTRYFKVLQHLRAVKLFIPLQRSGASTDWSWLLTQAWQTHATQTLPQTFVPTKIYALGLHVLRFATSKDFAREELLRKSR